MNINCQNCQQQIQAALSTVPSAWRKQIADVVCNSIICAQQSHDCTEFKDCETVTVLSDFTTSGTAVSISFTDEHGVKVTRSFDFKDIINQSFNGLDPKCLATKSDWDAMTYVAKWQTIVDRVCQSCNQPTTTTTTSSTTTTTTIAASTTTTTTTPGQVGDAMLINNTDDILINDTDILII